MSVDECMSGWGAEIAKRAPTVQAPTHAENIEDAMVYSMQNKGGVVPEYIAELIGDEVENVENKLIDRNLAYPTPAEGWMHTAEFLSGDVRKRAAELNQERAGDPQFQRAYDVIKESVPEDIPLADIKAVSPMDRWVDPKWVNEFVLRVFHFDLRMYRRNADGSPAIGIDRIPNDVDSLNYPNEIIAFGKFIKLWVLAKPPQIKKENQEGKLVIDDDATAQVQSSLDELSLMFSDFIKMKHPKEVSKAYNKEFNSIIPFDITKIGFSKWIKKFPGMSLEMEDLFSHQVDGVEQFILKGSTGFNVGVGGGKTRMMFASMLEAKRLGFAKKPMMVTRNNLVPGFVEDAKKTYPNARVIGITKKEDVPKIASGKYDVVIMAYSTFDNIDVSDSRREQYNKDRINELRKALQGGAMDRVTEKNIDELMKRLEEDQATIAERQKGKTAMALKGLNFENLGVDMLVVDEAHNYKNLTLISNEPSLAYKSDSAKVEAMDNKASYIREINPTHGIILSSATPVSNKMSELWVFMKYLGDDIGFESWRSLYTEAESYFTIDMVNQTVEVRESIAFKNLKSLRNRTLNRMFVKQDLEDSIKGRPEKVYKDVEVSEPNGIEDVIALQKKVIPDKKRGGALGAYYIGMRAATSIFSVFEKAPKSSETLFGKSAAEMRQIYSDTNKDRGVQLAFLDQGDSKTEDTKKIYNMHRAMRMELLKVGIPENEILTFTGEIPAKKRPEFLEKIQAGDYRIVLGSTSMLGEGVNVQDRIKAVHHLSIPWRPSDMEQREGRAWRKGNMYEKVLIFRYMVKGTFAARLWATLAKKYRSIKQLFDMNSDVDTIEWSTQNMSYAEIAALVARNPLLAFKQKIEKEFKALSANKVRINNAYNRAAESMSTIRGNIGSLEADLNDHIRQKENARPTKGDKFNASIGNLEFTDRGKFAEELKKQYRAASAEYFGGHGWHMEIGGVSSTMLQGEIEFGNERYPTTSLVDDKMSPSTLIRAMEAEVKKILSGYYVEGTTEMLEQEKLKLQDNQAIIDKGKFKDEEKHEELKQNYYLAREAVKEGWKGTELEDDPYARPKLGWPKLYAVGSAETGYELSGYSVLPGTNKYLGDPDIDDKLGNIVRRIFPHAEVHTATRLFGNNGAALMESQKAALGYTKHFPKVKHEWTEETPIRKKNTLKVVGYEKNSFSRDRDYEPLKNMPIPRMFLLKDRNAIRDQLDLVRRTDLSTKEIEEAAEEASRLWFAALHNVLDKKLKETGWKMVYDSSGGREVRPSNDSNSRYYVEGRNSDLTYKGRFLRVSDHQHPNAWKIKEASGRDVTDEIVIPSTAEGGWFGRRIFLPSPREWTALDYQKALEKFAHSVESVIPNIKIGLPAPRKPGGKWPVRPMPARAEVAGKVDRQRMLIKIALNEKYDPVETAYHEAYHLARMLLTDEEVAVLKNEYSTEEQEAYAFADYMAHGKGPNNWIKRIWAKLKLMFKRVGQALRRNGYKSSKDIFDEVAVGRIGRRPIEEWKRYKYPDIAYSAPDGLGDYYGSVSAKAILSIFEDPEAKAAAHKLLRHSYIANEPDKDGNIKGNPPMTLEEIVAMSNQVLGNTRLYEDSKLWPTVAATSQIVLRESLRTSAGYAETIVEADQMGERSKVAENTQEFLDSLDLLKKSFNSYSKVASSAGRALGVLRLAREAKITTEFRGKMQNHLKQMLQQAQDGEKIEFDVGGQKITGAEIAQAQHGIVKKDAKQGVGSEKDVKARQQLTERVKKLERTINNLNQEIRDLKKRLLSQGVRGRRGQADSQRLKEATAEKAGTDEEIKRLKQKIKHLNNKIKGLVADRMQDSEGLLVDYLKTLTESEQEAINKMLESSYANIIAVAKEVMAANRENNISLSRVKDASFRGGKLVNIFYNSLLSSPWTTAVNIVSNTTMLAVYAPIIDSISGALPGGRGAKSGIDGFKSFAMLPKAWDALMYGLDHGVIKYTFGGKGIYDEMSVHDQRYPHDMAEVWGTNTKWFRIAPQRWLTATDSFYKTLGAYRIIYQQAHQFARQRGLTGDAKAEFLQDYVNNPPVVAIRMAIQHSRDLTFTTPPTNAASALIKFRDSTGVIGLYMMPFVRVLWNLIRVGGRLVPGLSLLSYGINKKSGRTRMVGMNRLMGREGSVKRNDIIAEQLMGMGITLFAIYGVSSGFITGGGPDEPDKRNVWLQTHKPYSILIGSTWYSYSRFTEPFALPMAIISTSIEHALGRWLDNEVLLKGEESALDDLMAMLLRVGAAAAKTIGTKTMLSNIKSMAEAATGTEEALIKVGLTGLIPSMLSWLARLSQGDVMLDPQVLSDYVFAKIPFMHKGANRIIPKYDYFGDPVKRTVDIGQDTPKMRAKLELSRLYTGIPRLRPKVRGVVGGEYVEYDMSPQVFERYQKFAGEVRWKAISGLLNSPGYLKANDDNRKRAIGVTLERVNRYITKPAVAMSILDEDTKIRAKAIHNISYLEGILGRI